MSDPITEAMSVAAGYPRTGDTSAMHTTRRDGIVIVIQGGGRACGKSVIATVIADALAAIGYSNVKMKGVDPVQGEPQERLKGISGQPTPITIIEVRNIPFGNQAPYDGKYIERLRGVLSPEYKRKFLEGDWGDREGEPRCTCNESKEPCPVHELD